MKTVLKAILIVCITFLLLCACTSSTAKDSTENSSGGNTTLKATNTPETKTIITPRILKEGEIAVTSIDELREAMSDAKVHIIYIDSNMETTSEINVEREDDLSIIIEKNVTLTVTKDFVVVGCSVQNDGTMVINGTFHRGIGSLINNGTVSVKPGGKVGSGMSTTENYGQITVEIDGEMVIEQGTIFNNYGTLDNLGYMDVCDGGQLNDMGGKITNDGTLDISSYFNGDMSLITGTGRLNDKRQ